MTVEFTRWPDALAARYREKGYWQDLPLTDMLTRHADSDAIAVIDGERQISYRQLNQSVDNLAAALQRQGLKRGETALVQLGNISEFYTTLFALLNIGVAPVNALFSHQRNELNAYAEQIAPAVLIADRSHALFGDDTFLNTFCEQFRSVRVVLLRQGDGEHALEAAMAEPAGDFTPTPTAADEVAFSSFRAAVPGRRSLSRGPTMIITTASVAATRCAILTRKRAICALSRRRTTTP